MRKSRFSEDRIIGVLKEHHAGVPVAELRRKQGMSDATFCAWRSRHGGMEGVPDARRLQAPGEESRRLKTRLRLTYRGLEDLLRLSGPLRRVSGLRVVPDHATVWWFARRRVGPGLLDAALAETVRRARGGAERAAQVALDCTGLFLSHTPRHFARRAKRDRGQRGWLKRASALWVGPRIPLAQRVRPGPCGGSPTPAWRQTAPPTAGGGGSRPPRPP